jgi:ribosome-associated heat shock protein Hsp15
MAGAGADVVGRACLTLFAMTPAVFAGTGLESAGRDVATRRHDSSLNAKLQLGASRRMDFSMNYKISTEPDARLRIDKWLWAARFFKTRSLAADAVEKGRVRIGGATVKPAKDVRVGDLVEVEIERIVWLVRVMGVCEMRGPAAVAQTLYEETPEGKEKRAAEAERRKTFREPADELQGRPTKRDRRVIDKFSSGRG